MRLTKREMLVLTSIYEDRNYTTYRPHTAVQHADPDLYARIKKASKQSGRQFSQVIYDALYTRPSCQQCGASTKFSPRNFDYSNYCSTLCSNRSPITRRKAKQTCLARYGVENASQVPEVKAQKIETCLRNHGVAHPQQSRAVRSRSVETLLTNYGVDNPSKSDVVQQRKVQTWIDKYGVDNPMHDQVVMERALTNAHKVKKFTIEGKTFQYMGYESLVIERLVQKGIPVENIHCFCGMPPIYYVEDGRYRKYVPDIRFTDNGQQVLIEVKSHFTLGLFKQHDRFWNWRRKVKAARKLKGFKFLTVLVRDGSFMVVKSLDLKEVQAAYLERFG